MFAYSTVSLAFEVHRYKVNRDRFSIYPANIALEKQQQHAALYQLVRLIKQSDPSLTQDFARIALHEMAALYETEARRLSINGLHITQGMNIYRWQQATVDYANGLYETAESINDQSDIEINIADTGELHILVDQELYILGTPVLRSSLLLDRQIIEMFCRLNYCEGIGFQEELFDTTRTIIIRSDWIIEESRLPEFATTDGLHFVFSDLENRREKQRICLNISKELKTLEVTLKEAEETGLHIDWDSLSIEPLYGSYDYRVVINPFGDSVYMQFPSLHRIKDWQEKISPWLKARLENHDHHHYFQEEELQAFGIG